MAVGEVVTSSLPRKARAPPNIIWNRGDPGKGFWNGASALKQYFVLPKNGSKYYLKYTFLVFPILGILGLGTPLIWKEGVHDLKT